MKVIGAAVLFCTSKHKLIRQSGAGLDEGAASCRAEAVSNESRRR